MNKHVQISLLRKQDIGSELFNKLQTVYPEGTTLIEDQFVLPRLPDSDPCIDKIESSLEAAGMQPWEHGPLDRAKHYSKRVFREYTDTELEGFDYLRLMIPADEDRYFLAYTRDPRGYILADAQSLPSKNPYLIARANSTGYVVPDRFKRLLEQSGLKRVAFKPTIPTANCEPKLPSPYTEWRPEHGEVWWELTSDLMMPRLSLKTDLHYSRNRGDRLLTKAERSVGDLGAGIYPREGFYADPEFRYDAKKVYYGLPEPQDWDAAVTREPFEGLLTGWHYLIVSQRFYRFCQDQGVDARWVPVHIDED